jgi:predicted Zn-dependent protease
MAWMDARMMFDEEEDGSRVKVGRIEERGPNVDRAQRVLNRLLPPYVDRSQVRVRVVQNEDWNAAAMGNGSLWVYSGLMDDLDDDELAVVLGHELAHYTHEHSRRQFKRDLIGQLLLGGIVAGAQAIDNGKARAATTIGAVLASVALASNYSRDQEDQADRVGLRYLNEGGYGVRRGPEMWQKFQEKYGNGNAVTSFLFGSHSRPSDRIRNVEREIAINYRDAES